MAIKITAQVLGGESVVVDGVSTVQELVNKLSSMIATPLNDLAVTINGEDAGYEDDLYDYSFVSFGEKVKGGAKKIAPKKTAPKKIAKKTSKKATKKIVAKKAK